tara:strand:- start:128 stop:451 length:324 start_codon:yes stop_codon:yes gene_type:complete
MSCLSLLLAASVHVGLEKNYNAVHPHARCTINQTIAGVYFNSESKVSAYIGQKFGALEVGLVTGYSKTIVPMIRLVKNGWFITPAYEVKQSKNNWGFTFGYELPLRF